MKRYTLNILIFVQVLCSIVFGQTTKKIFGYVYDSNSSLPLIGANVVIDGTVIGTATDEFGYFQFDNLLTDSYSLTASFIGYENKTINDINVLNDQSVKTDFHLNEAENKLKEILVSGLNNNVFENAKRYTSIDISNGNYQSVAEVLEQAASVEIQSTGGVGSNKKISIRGSETNQVLVLLDGIPLNDQFGGSADLSSIPTNIVESIDVYEGGSSSKFGSGAIGGAINIITKKRFKNEYKINLSGGSFGFFNVEPTFSGNYKNLSYYLAYNQINSDGNYPYKHPNTDGTETKTKRINANMKSQNIFVRINYKFSNFLLSLNAQKLNSNRGIPGKTRALSAYAKSKNNTSNFGTNIKGTFSDVVWNLNYSYLKNKTENSNLYPTNALPEYKRYTRYHYEYETNTNVIASTSYYKFADWLNVTGGYSGKWLEYNDKNFATTLKKPIDNATDVSHGLYLHQEYKINFAKPIVTFSISPSVRYDEMEMKSGDLTRFEHQWSPSFSLFSSVGKENKIYLKTSISRSFRVPTFSDLFYQDVRVEGKPDLLPERSLNREIGFGWDINFLGNLKGEINLYNYSIDNMIIWKLGSFEVFRPFNNDAEITGQTYSLNYQLPKNNFSFFISYTHLEPLDKNNNKTTHNKIIPYRPQHSVKSKINFGYKNFSGIVNFRFVGNRFVTVANTVVLPYYYVLDIALLQELDIARVKTILKLSVNNITNELYEVIRGYPIPGREFRLGITLSYK